MLTTFKNIAFIALSFVIGFTFFSRVTEQSTQRRTLAAASTKIFQITDLTPAQIKEQLYKKIKVTPTLDGKKSISFSGFSSSLCKVYSSIEVEFTAEGVTVSGQAPIMKINSPCTEAQDPSEIAAISLPIAKILKEKPRNAEYKFDGFSSTIAFSNSADEWPQQWVLKRVEFKNQSGANKTAEFNRSPASVGDNFEKPIVLEF